MWTLLFWKGLAERAVRTFAQVLGAALAISGADGLTSGDWTAALELGLLASLLSVLTSLAAGLLDTDPVVTPSLVRTMPRTVHRRPVSPPDQPPT